MASKKIMLVLPPRDFPADVCTTIRQVLAGHGHTVTATSVARSATSDDGRSVPVDVPLKDVKTWDHDAFVFIGGEGTRLYFGDEQVIKLAKDVKYKTLGATGNAAVILALAEALKGKRATTDTDWAQLVERHGARYTGRPLEVDDKVITLQDAAAAEQFANAMAKALA